MVYYSYEIIGYNFKGSMSISARLKGFMLISARFCSLHLFSLIFLLNFGISMFLKSFFNESLVVFHGENEIHLKPPSWQSLSLIEFLTRNIDKQLENTEIWPVLVLDICWTFVRTQRGSSIFGLYVGCL